MPGNCLPSCFAIDTFIDRRAGGSVVYRIPSVVPRIPAGARRRAFRRRGSRGPCSGGRSRARGGRADRVRIRPVCARGRVVRGGPPDPHAGAGIHGARPLAAARNLDRSGCPVSIRDSMPWLTFWQGTCGVFANPAAGRGLLEQAYARFKAAGDRAGCLMTWAGISESYFLEFNRFDGMDPWIIEIEQLLPTFSEFPDLMVEARVLAGATGMAFRRPQHPAIRLWTTRALELIPRLADPGQRIGIASFATMVFIWRGDIEHGLQAWALTGVDAESPDTPPLHSIFLNINVAGLLWQRAEHDEGDPGARGSAAHFRFDRGAHSRPVFPCAHDLCAPQRGGHGGSCAPCRSRRPPGRAEPFPGSIPCAVHARGRVVPQRGRS